MGCYDEDTQTIAIDIDLKYVQKRCTLVHELMHWKHGDQSCPGIASQQDRATRAQGHGTVLIDPMEYATWRHVRGQQIQDRVELNLTVQVVEDYMRILRDLC